MSYTQEWIEIGNVQVPIILDEGGEKYYPMRYVNEKVLLRKGKTMIGKNAIDQYEQFIKQYNLKYNEHGVQMTNCISEQGLKLFLSKTQVGRLSASQRKAQNHIHKLIDLKLISEAKIDIEHLSRDNLNQHDKYTREMIKLDIDDAKSNGEKLSYRLCSKCNKYHPLTSKYYLVDNRVEKGFGKVCKVCSGKYSQFTSSDVDAQMLKKESEELYIAYANNYIIPIFEAYRQGKIKHMPECYVNKDDYLKLIKYMYDKGEINNDEISISILKEKTKLNKLTQVLNIIEVYKFLFGEGFYLYPYRYGKFRFIKEFPLTDEIAFKIFKNYIKDNNIDDSNPLIIDYENIAKSAKLNSVSNGKVLEFAVKYNQYEFAGYMFKTKSVNYYHNEENVMFDLAYLIEKDMKIEIDKIPLYVTKNVLRIKCLPLYNYIITKNNGSLFYWFDRLYPNKFIETDFDINAYRLEFDSDTEAFIHDILKDKFKNRLIYNQRNGEREIRLNGMSPDWFIFTDNGVWIVEYFGMFNWKNRNNSRTRGYIRKTINKLRRYREVTGYNKLFLYLEDTYDDYRGIVEKVKVIEDQIGNSDTNIDK